LATELAWELVLSRVDKKTDNSLFTERLGRFQPM
jgi:hypothetical protein